MRAEGSRGVGMFGAGAGPVRSLAERHQNRSRPRAVTVLHALNPGKDAGDSKNITACLAGRQFSVICLICSHAAQEILHTDNLRQDGSGDEAPQLAGRPRRRGCANAILRAGRYDEPK